MADKQTTKAMKENPNETRNLLSELDNRINEMQTLVRNLPDKEDVDSAKERKESEAGQSCPDSEEAPVPASQDDDDYPLTHHHRGDCLLFVNTKFKGGDLPYTKKDIRACEHTFNSLGFIVTLYEDLNKEQLLRTLEEASQKDRSDHDALVVVFSSHGNKSSTGREVLNTRDGRLDSALLWANFIKSKTLQGKPKLFFIDACRGPGSDDKVGLVVSTDSIKDNTKSTAPVFYHPDLLVMNSSYAGMMSATCKGADFKGSVFTQMLCRTLLDELASRKDVVEVLQKVTRLVAARYSKQVPQMSSTLTRRLVLGYGTASRSSFK